MQAKFASLPFGGPRNHMFSVPHLIIIFAVALMVFGPEKLPELARTLGKVMGEFRRATGDLRSTFEGHMRELEREAELRRVREAQPPTQSIGGDSPAPALPECTPAASAERASSEDPLPPAPGTSSTWLHHAEISETRQKQMSSYLRDTTLDCRHAGFSYRPYSA